MDQQMKVSSKGGLVVSLKELIDMKRIGMKYKVNHRTKDIIAFRNFLNHEINQRIGGRTHGKNKKENYQKENTSKN
ncbi:hypothetical protein K9M74_03280 [Candidatus Woesearchaeota archaeon]|nr:hypothetical protein [Candidatus Woesearchaeota archaeon]MCF7859163.1 hypothetical protein [Candidatus Cloacimonadota bacterium]MCF8012816.1 hypothetical protein [Candidatus Woesearchaeota archaeon]